MRHASLGCIAFLSFASLVLAAPTSAPAPPGMDEIHTRFDAGDYNGTLAAINHVMSAGAKALEQYDKHELLTLRGETHLRLKQTEAAIAAFRQAAKATDDPEKVALDEATEILIQRSKQSEYVPKTAEKGAKPSAPISILEPDKRKLAFRALFSDEWAAVAPTLKSAKASDSLTVIASAVKAIQSRRLSLLDAVANGNEDQTKQAITGLRDHAAELMSKAMERLGKRQQEITSSANEIVHQQVMVPDSFGRLQPSDRPRRRGLQGTDRQDLTAIARTAMQIGAAAREIVGGLGDKSVADDLADQANDLVQRTQKALEADYSHG